VDPVVDARDMTDIAPELARRTDLLEPYNQAINRGAAGMRLATEGFDYSLDDSKAHSCEAIWDAVARAASGVRQLPPIRPKNARSAVTASAVST